jgi:hypothetical protein
VHGSSLNTDATGDRKTCDRKATFFFQVSDGSFGQIITASELTRFGIGLLQRK